MSNIAFWFLPLAFFSLPAVLPFVSPFSQVELNLTLKELDDKVDKQHESPLKMSDAIFGLAAHLNLSVWGYCQSTCPSGERAE